MQQYTRSLQGGLLQARLLLGLPHVAEPNTTLNEALDIATTISPADTDRQSMSVLVIGNRGHYSVRENGIDLFRNYPHRPTDAGLYGQIPFVMRAIDDDLSAVERTKYRLRKVITHTDNKVYVLYYGRRLDLSNVSPRLEIRKKVDGVTTSVPFVPRVEDLRPSPPVMAANQVLTTTGEYAFATAKVDISIPLDEVQEIVNACKILYGSEDYAYISEMGLCAGVDRVVTGDFNGVTQGYEEAIATQIVTFIMTDHRLASRTKGIITTLDVGAIEPLIDLRNV